MTSAEQETATQNVSLTHDVDVGVNDVGRGTLFVTFGGFQVTLVYLLFNLLMMTVGATVILLNVIVVHVIARLQPKEPGDVLLLNLALTDGLTGVLVQYHAAYNLVNFQSATECFFRQGLLQLTCCSSAYHLVLLTLDRYVRIAWPLDYSDWWRVKRVATASVVVWLAAAIYGFLPLAGLNNKKESSPFACTFLGTQHPTYIKLMLSLYSLPFVVFMFLYSHIFLIARRHAARIAEQPTAQEANATSRASAGYERQSWRFTKTVSIIFGGYAVCWTPIGVVLCMHMNGFLNTLPEATRTNMVVYTSLTVFLNSLINPVIYAVKIPAVRMRFRHIRQRLCGGFLRTAPGASLSVS